MTQKIKTNFAKIPFFLTVSGLYISTVLYFLLKQASLEANQNPSFFGLLLYLPETAVTSTQFNFISKLGVCILSSLSGFGCVYMPFQMFRYYDPLITQINKDKIEDDMRLIVKEITVEKLELAQMKLDETNTNKAGKEKTGFFGGIMGSLFGSKSSKIERSVSSRKRSIKLNQQLLASLFVDYAEISQEERNMKRSKDRRFRNYFDKTIALFLLSFGLYKVVKTSLNLMLGRKNSKSDPISKTLNITAR
jgi:hypothetical protein